MNLNFDLCSRSTSIGEIIIHHCVNATLGPENTVEIFTQIKSLKITPSKRLMLKRKPLYDKSHLAHYTLSVDIWISRKSPPPHKK